MHAITSNLLTVILQTRLHAARPDLLTASHTQSTQPQSVQKSDAEMEEASDSEPEHDGPPASTIDTDSDGMALGTEPEDLDEFAADGDDDRDEDYMQEDENDSDRGAAIDDDPRPSDTSDDDDSGSEEDMKALLAEFLKARGNLKGKSGKKTKSKSAAKDKIQKVSHRSEH